MCGIVGTYKVIDSNNKIHVLLKSIAHRGLDEEGVITHKDVSLGMCQLKLMQSKESTIPFFLSDKETYVSYNGEVYSYEKNGHEIEPQDVNGEIQGVWSFFERTPAYVNGMFAASFYSVKDNKVVLIRDSFGIKPMYWKSKDNGITFSSEIGALKANDRLEFNLDTVFDVIVYGRVLNYDSTVFKDINVLERGSSISFSADGIEKSKLRVLDQKISHLDNLDSLVKESVRRCLNSKRKIGLAISGGIDSSLIASYINELGFEDLTTLSIRIEGSDDYLECLEDLNLKGGTAWKKWEHYVVDFTQDEYVDLLNESILIMGEPFQMSSVPLYLKIAKEAAHHEIKILLSGEGADELFLGYDSYKKVASQPEVDEEVIAQFYCGSEKDQILRKLLGSDVMDKQKAKLLSHVNQSESKLENIRRMELDLSLEPLLQRIDRCLMRYNIEGRTPFLHSRIPELSAAWGWEELVFEHKTKKVLVDLFHSKTKMKNPLRNKTAFRVPLCEWMPDALFEELAVGFERSSVLQKIASKENWLKFIEFVRLRESPAALNIFYTVYTIFKVEIEQNLGKN